MNEETNHLADLEFAQRTEVFAEKGRAVAQAVSRWLLTAAARV
jgi:hypothetical protein